MANTWKSPQTFHENAAFVEDGETDAQVLEDAGPTYTVDDCLTIKMAPDKSKIYYSFLFNFPFDAECSLAGMATAEGPNTWVHEFSLADEGDDQSMCRLVLKEKDGAWTVDDEANCRDQFCGARGSINHLFSASEKGPLSKCGYQE